MLSRRPSILLASPRRHHLTHLARSLSRKVRKLPLAPCRTRKPPLFGERLEANAGALTNFEVLDFLRSKGASKDPTRVLVPVTPSEFKAFDYLVDSPSCNQTREKINEFVEKCKRFKLAKAEVLNIINIRPSSLVEIDAIIEQSEQRFGDDLEGLVDLIAEVLPPHPNQAMAEIEFNDNNEGAAAGEQANDNTNETADGQTNIDGNQIADGAAMDMRVKTYVSENSSRR